MPMFINRQYAISLMMRYNSVIESALISGSIEQEIERLEQTNQVSFYNVSHEVTQGKFKEDFSKISKGSIAVVSVHGAMMRDDYCTMSDGFIAGTKSLEETVKALDANENVDAVVFSIDSPGGQAYGSESLSRVISSMSKPKLGHFENIMASAAVHAFQGVDKLYGNESQSSWGSIGTYVSFVNDAKFYEAMGLEIIEVYAPQSTEKNVEYRKALEGDNEPMEAMLQEMTAAFIKDVKKARPALENDGHVFKGKLYSATEAKKINAIDGIKSLDAVIKEARSLGRKSKSNKTKKNQTVMSLDEKKIGFFARIWGKDATVEDAETDMQKVEAKVTELTEQLSAANLTIKSEAEKLNAANTSLTEKEEENKVLLTSRETTAKELETINASIKEVGFDNIGELLEDHKAVLAHNVELGGIEGNTATPINNQQSNKTDLPKKKRKSYEETVAESKKTKAEKEKIKA